ncbi:hypothetical protein ACFWY9_21635 [Amycolatopsis sp. NPDC059027]|uniref:hypothetical protein n=1 Tax=unclassified Amycolatopsis TaxID=2618356 RepID=UPI00366ED3BF
MRSFLAVSRRCAVLALVVVTGVAGSATAGVATPTVPASPAAATWPTDATGVQDAQPPISHVFDGMFKSTPEELKTVAEEACDESSTGALPERVCNELTAEQVDRLPADLKAQVDELEKLAKEDLAARDSLAQPRSIAGVAQVLDRVTKLSNNPAMKQLTGKGGQFADWAGRATTAAGGLTAGNVVEYAKSVAYIAASFVPGVGDLMSLVEGITTGNVEQSVVAVVGLAGVAIGLAFPPAGAVIAVGLAVYSLAKYIWSFFEARTRDWVNDPPGTPEELRDRGADIKWTDHKLPGKKDKVNVVLSKTGHVATQTMLLDSKWTKYNRDQRPVKYTLQTTGRLPGFYPGTFYTNVINGIRFKKVEMTVAQGGKVSNPVKCFPDENYPQKDLVTIVVCATLKPVVTISAGHSAVLKLKYFIDNPSEDIDEGCAPPCVFDRENLSFLFVHAERSEQPIQLPVHFRIGVVP